MIQKDKTRVDIYGERFRTRASQLTPGLRTVASYINEHREVVLEQTAMEIAATLNIPMPQLSGLYRLWGLPGCVI